jgi:hypothetical protein
LITNFASFMIEMAVLVAAVSPENVFSTDQF